MQPSSTRHDLVPVSLTERQLQTMMPCLSEFAAQRLEMARRHLRIAGEFAVVAVLSDLEMPIVDDLSEFRDGIQQLVDDIDSWVLDADHAEAWVGTAHDGTDRVPVPGGPMSPSAARKGDAVRELATRRDTTSEAIRRELARRDDNLEQAGRERAEQLDGSDRVSIPDGLLLSDVSDEDARSVAALYLERRHLREEQHAAREEHLAAQHDACESERQSTTIKVRRPDDGLGASLDAMRAEAEPYEEDV